MYCYRLKGSNSNTIRLDLETIKILNKYIRQNEINDNQQILFLSQEKKTISRKTLDVLMKNYLTPFITSIDGLPPSNIFFTLKPISGFNSGCVKM